MEYLGIKGIYAYQAWGVIAGWKYKIAVVKGGAEDENNFFISTVRASFHETVKLSFIRCIIMLFQV